MNVRVSSDNSFSMRLKLAELRHNSIARHQLDWLANGGYLLYPETESPALARPMISYGAWMTIGPEIKHTYLRAPLTIRYGAGVRHDVKFLMGESVGHDAAMTSQAFFAMQQRLGIEARASLDLDLGRMFDKPQLKNRALLSFETSVYKSTALSMMGVLSPFEQNLAYAAQGPYMTRALQATAMVKLTLSF
jgi:hypothetical protein